MAKPVPEGYHTATPYLVVKDGAAAIEFYKKAFGAQELHRMKGPGGQGIVHAEIKIGDSPVMLSEEFPGMDQKAPTSVGAVTGSVMLYVDDVDRWVQRASGAGASVVSPPSLMFWGDRFAKLKDPFGHEWAVATHVEDVSEAEMERRGQDFFAQMAKQGA